MNGLKNIKTKQLLIIIAYLLFYLLFASAWFLSDPDVDIDIDSRYVLKSLSARICLIDKSPFCSVYLIDKTSPDALAINGVISRFQVYNNVIVGDISDEKPIDSGNKRAPVGYFILDRKSGKTILGLSENKFMKILDRDYNINEMPKFEGPVENYHKYFGLKPKDRK